MDKKTLALILIALLFVLIYISEIPQSAVLGLNITVNNTNLAPDAGPPHPFGTGERVSGNTYWTNDSDIELFVFAHASVVSQTAEIHLLINGTIVADTSGRPVGGAEESNKTVVAIIPRYSNYSVQFINTHHYEWREYKILSGNVTTNISGTGGAGCTGNCSFDGVWTNSIRKNDTTDIYGDTINLSSPFAKRSITNPITSLFTLNDGEFFTLQSTNSSSGNVSNLFGNPEQIRLTVTNGDASILTVSQDYLRYSKAGTVYNQNNTHMDYGGTNITNLNNLTMFGFLNSTGNVTISNASLNLKTNTSFYYDFALVPRLYRNVTSTAARTSPLATLNMILGIDTGYISNGGGPAVIFWNKDNVSAGETEYNIGRVSVVWRNKTANTTAVDFYARSGTTDVNAVSKVMSVYNNGSNNGAAGDTLANATIETGKIVLDGVGKGITMLSPDGNDWCVTVTNAGGLNVATTPCT